MKKEQIEQLFQQFENACVHLDGVECWSARDLQVIFNYSEWRNFVKVIVKAKEACENSGIKVSDQFVDVNKLIEMPKGAQRIVEDIAFTRYACYLVAQNGDANKPEKPLPKPILPYKPGNKSLLNNAYWILPVLPPGKN